MNEHPRWVYPDGDVARGKLLHSDAEEAAYLDQCAHKNAHDRANNLLIEALAEAVVLPVLEEPPARRKYTRKAQ